nr:MAG TPA_asm: hypothetical protein [Caudoviricetes sp.]
MKNGHLQKISLRLNGIKPIKNLLLRVPNAPTRTQ